MRCAFFSFTHNFVAVPLVELWDLCFSGKRGPNWLERFYDWTYRKARNDSLETRVKFVSEVTPVGAVKNTLVFQNGKLTRVE